MSQIIQISNFFRYQNPIKFNLKFLTKIFILLLFTPSVLFAQSTLSERNKTVEISEITFSFDEFSIISSSPERLFSVDKQEMPTPIFQLYILGLF